MPMRFVGAVIQGTTDQDTNHGVGGSVDVESVPVALVHTINWNAPKYLIADVDLFIGGILGAYLVMMVFNLFLPDSGWFDRALIGKHWRRLLAIAVLAAILIASAYAIGGRWSH